METDSGATLVLFNVTMAYGLPVVTRRAWWSLDAMDPQILSELDRHGLVARLDCLDGCMEPFRCDQHAVLMPSVVHQSGSKLLRLIHATLITQPPPATPTIRVREPASLANLQRWLADEGPSPFPRQPDWSLNHVVTVMAAVDPIGFVGINFTIRSGTRVRGSPSVITGHTQRRTLAIVQVASEDIDITRKLAPDEYLRRISPVAALLRLAAEELYVEEPETKSVDMVETVLGDDLRDAERILAEANDAAAADDDLTDEQRDRIRTARAVVETAVLIRKAISDS